jgi:hypothetical protein
VSTALQEHSERETTYESLQNPTGFTDLSNASRFPKEHCFLQGFQASPFCPGKSNQYVDGDEYGALVE